MHYIYNIQFIQILFYIFYIKLYSLFDILYYITMVKKISNISDLFLVKRNLKKKWGCIQTLIRCRNKNICNNNTYTYACRRGQHNTVVRGRMRAFDASRRLVGDLRSSSADLGRARLSRRRRGALVRQSPVGVPRVNVIRSRVSSSARALIFDARTKSGGLARCFCCLCVYKLLFTVSLMRQCRGWRHVSREEKDRILHEIRHDFAAFKSFRPERGKIFRSFFFCFRRPVHTSYHRCSHKDCARRIIAISSKLMIYMPSSGCRASPIALIAI